MDTNTMLMAVMGLFVVLMIANQQKFKDKMLCLFRRPNNQLIEKWVPLYSRWVVFDRGKYGVERYIIDPNCLSHMWYDRGLSRFFPVLIPTMEFRWDTPYPLNPKTFEVTWQSPEAVNASFQSYQHTAFARGAATQSGARKKYPEWLFPIATIGVILIIGYLVWQMQGQLNYLQRLVIAGG